MICVLSYAHYNFEETPISYIIVYNLIVHSPKLDSAHNQVFSYDVVIAKVTCTSK